jgi:integrase
MFTTKNGLPLVRQDVKSEDELLNGTRTRPPSKRLVKKTDVVTQHWQRLLLISGVKWKQGFYALRHIGATAFAKRPGIGLIEIRSFLGHATSQMSDHYMKPLKPEYRPVIEWINWVLSSDDMMAWEDKPDEFAKTQEMLKDRKNQKGKKKSRRKRKTSRGKR